MSRMGFGETTSKKGDKHSGGGGRRGGGGKKGRPLQGWEKGDVVRDVDDFESPFEVPAKPGARKRLLQDPVEVKEARKKEALAARHKKGEKRITIVCEDTLLHRSLRAKIRDRVSAEVSHFKKLRTTQIRFENIHGTGGENAIMCRIKTWVHNAKSAVVYFTAPGIGEAFNGAMVLWRDAIENYQVRR